MAPSRRFLAVLALTAALAAACTNEDADRADVVEALEQADAPTEQAQCVGSRLTGEDPDDETDLSRDELDEFALQQGDLNDVANASDLEDLEDEDVLAAVRGALDACFGAGGSGEDTDTTDTTDAAEDSTTTTEG